MRRCEVGFGIDRQRPRTRTTITPKQAPTNGPQEVDLPIASPGIHGNQTFHHPAYPTSPPLGNSRHLPRLSVPPSDRRCTCCDHIPRRRSRGQHRRPLSRQGPRRYSVVRSRTSRLRRIKLHRVLSRRDMDICWLARRNRRISVDRDRIVIPGVIRRVDRFYRRGRDWSRGRVPLREDPIGIPGVPVPRRRFRGPAHR